MLKKKLGRLVDKVSMKMAKGIVSEASPYWCYQEKEPENAKELIKKIKK